MKQLTLENCEAIQPFQNHETINTWKLWSNLTIPKPWNN